MTVKRLQFHCDADGSLHQNEDFWTLVFDTKIGQATVEHSWHYMNPYKSTVTGEGSESQTLVEFVASPDGARLKRQFETALRRVGIDPGSLDHC